MKKKNYKRKTVSVSQMQDELRTSAGELFDCRKELAELKSRIIEDATGYKCKSCGEVYEDRNDAIMCCINVEEVPCFMCKSCGSFYEDEEKAINCCH